MVTKTVAVQCWSVMKSMMRGWKDMSELVNVAEIFGKNVFNETVMRERLPKSVFKKLKKTIEDGTELDPSIERLGN